MWPEVIEELELLVELTLFGLLEGVDVELKLELVLELELALELLVESELEPELWLECELELEPEALL